MGSHVALNTFDQRGFPLGYPLGPNADVRSVRLRKWLPHRTRLDVSFARSKKGLNPVDAEGRVIRNVGGSLMNGAGNEGFRFLEGADVQEYNEITVAGFTEPFRGIELSFRFTNRSMKTGTRMLDRRILDFRAKLFTPLAPVFAYLIPQF